jgi:dTDP-4-amino-4,6-dideoxygalactose transaminase
MAEITGKGVPCFSGSCGEIYLEKAFADLGMGPKDRLPMARELGETSLMFLVHPTLSAATLNSHLEAIHAVLTEASVG